LGPGGVGEVKNLGKAGFTLVWVGITAIIAGVGAAGTDPVLRHGMLGVSATRIIAAGIVLALAGIAVHVRAREKMDADPSLPSPQPIRIFIPFNGRMLSADDFCTLVMHAMCGTALGPNDPRLVLQRQIAALRYFEGGSDSRFLV
jgi:hypothetical protein